MEYQVLIKSFYNLNPSQLFDIFHLRQQVFILEQKCFYPDIDETDKESFHVLVYKGKELASTCRIVPPGIKYKGASIGRVCSNFNFRAKNCGKLCLTEAMAYCDLHYPNYPVEISAQTYLIPFYGYFGFQPLGEVYPEDDQPHIYMIRKNK